MMVLRTCSPKLLPCLCMLCIAVFGITCGKRQQIPKSNIVQDKIPVQEFTGQTTMLMTDSGRTQWVLRTPHIVREGERDRMVARPVEFDYYGGQKKVVSHLTAKYGEADGAEFESFFVRDSVRVSSSKGYRLEANDLRWDQKGNRVVSDGRVRFTTKQGDVLRGKGFVSDPDLENWKILSDVQGEFQQFEKRMDKGEF